LSVCTWNIYEELRPRRYGVKYKTQLCKNYHLEGHCRFGSRCKFIHDEERIQVGDREFWLISPSENLVRVEVVENPQRATQLKQLLDTDTATYRVDLPSNGTVPTTNGNTSTSSAPPTSTLTTIPTNSLPETTSSIPIVQSTNMKTTIPMNGTINGTNTMELARPTPHTITLPSNTHIPITPQSPSLQQIAETPFYTSTGYFQPATVTSPSTGFPPAPSSTSSPSIPQSPGFLYSNLTGISGISSPGGSVPHTPVGHYFGYGSFSPQVPYSPLGNMRNFVDYIQMAATMENPPLVSPLSSASPSPSGTPIHMSPLVPLTRTLHQTFSLRRASSQPQSQQGSPAGMIRGRTLTTQLPPIS